MVNDQVIVSSEQIVLAHAILSHRGDVDSISTASMLLDTPKAFGNSIERH